MMMTPLTGDELLVLVKARDLLRAKVVAGHSDSRLELAHAAVLDVMHHSYLELSDDA